MGMDVYGRKPTTTEGEYFRNNIWWWGPLASYIEATAPLIAARCKYWHSNDGDGLNAKWSLALAEALEAEVDSGRCAAYATEYEASQPTDLGGFTYPFSVENVEKFIVFLRGCGGFTID